MKTFSSNGEPRAAALVICLSAACLLFAPSPAVSAQEQQQPPRPPAQAPADGESESLDLRADLASRPRYTDPAAVMRAARTVFVHSKTAFVKDAEVENELRKRPEFQAWGLAVTRDESRADLILEVERKAFTKRFVFAVVEPRTLSVVASGKMRSIVFGKTIAHKVAEKFVNRMKRVRT